jgi:hypothetical protein
MPQYLTGRTREYPISNIQQQNVQVGRGLGISTFANMSYPEFGVAHVFFGAEPLYWQLMVGAIPYNGTLVIHSCSLYGLMEVRKQRLGLYFSKNTLRLFDFKFSSALTSIGTISF